MLVKFKVMMQQDLNNISKHVFFIVSLSVVYALCSQIIIPLPFNLVPLSIQPLPVLLASWWLGKVAFYAYGLYLLEGLCGFPVFAHGGCGLMHLAGPTGGYLLGFAAASLALVALRSLVVKYKIIASWYMRAFCYMGVTVLVFMFGLAQLSIFIPLPRLLLAGLYPFIVGDFVIKATLFVIGTSLGIFCEKN